MISFSDSKLNTFRPSPAKLLLLMRVKLCLLFSCLVPIHHITSSETTESNWCTFTAIHTGFNSSQVFLGGLKDRTLNSKVGLLAWSFGLDLSMSHDPTTINSVYTWLWLQLEVGLHGIPPYTLHHLLQLLQNCRKPSLSWSLLGTCLVSGS